MTMQYLKIETNRDAYSVNDIRRTMTVGELISLLEDYDEDMPVYLSFDNGYTYGGISEGQVIDDEFYCKEDEEL